MYSEITCHRRREKRDGEGYNNVRTPNNNIRFGGILSIKHEAKKGKRKFEIRCIAVSI